MKQQSVVTVVGTLSDGKKVSQDITLTHDLTAPDQNLLAQAFTHLKTLGGFLEDGSSSAELKFYPLACCTCGVILTLKKVSLALGVVPKRSGLLA
jgi:hypothetical protein